MLSTNYRIIDGVAPRAKMNQQRSRRFRAAQEAKEKEMQKQEFIAQFKNENKGQAPPQSEEGAVKKAFDSNSITPGTPFMDILAKSLRYWIAYKLNTDPAWEQLKIIISDASVPGEGEHKIMNFVRSQRVSQNHDPNTKHVIYGLDADLIMLGMATHEAHFRVLREDVFAQQGKARTCHMCGQPGHEARNCTGEARKPEPDQNNNDIAKQKPFIWLKINVLREYLHEELYVHNLPFQWDLERALDDWIFLCFFVGNDFLPHLPALEIREDGIITLTSIWKEALPLMGGYVTKDGDVDLNRAQIILSELGKREKSIFKRRKENEERREANNAAKRRRLDTDSYATANGKGQYGGWNLPQAPAPAVTHDMVINKINVANQSAASVLRAQIQKMHGKNSSPDTDLGDGAGSSQLPPPASALGKRKASLVENEDAGTPASSDLGTPVSEKRDNGEPVDTVRLWEPGYADRYYVQKFKADPNDMEFRYKVGRQYMEGLAWVLRYYFQGCPSWQWYYPHHYAPFAEDFVDLGKLELKWEKGRILRPYEQLMSVLPAASRHALPEVFHDLMLNSESPIIDFYPEDFELDLNGKKMIWQAVILLPFIDMPRLLAAVEAKYHLLTEDEQRRNGLGHDILMFSDSHALDQDVSQTFFGLGAKSERFELDPRVSDGLIGAVVKPDDFVPHMTLMPPFDTDQMEAIPGDRSITVYYEMPRKASHIHKSMLLRGARLPPPVLTENDKYDFRIKVQKSSRSYEGVSLGIQRQDRRGQPRGSYSYGGNTRGGYGNNSNGRGGYEYDNRNQGNKSGYQKGRDGHSYDYNRGNGRSNYNRRPQELTNPIPVPPPGWIPPPPGTSSFGAGLLPPPGGAGFSAAAPLPPPPPPPAHYSGYNAGYGNPRHPTPRQGGYGNHHGSHSRGGYRRGNQRGYR